jgi:hypothetical protein
MASKPKSKTFIVHQNGNYKEPTVIGRYKVGARDRKEAESLLRGVIGKHTKVRVYYEEKVKLVPHGTVTKEC